MEENSLPGIVFNSNCAQTRFEIIFFCLCSIRIKMVIHMTKVEIQYTLPSVAVRYKFRSN